MDVRSSKWVFCTSVVILCVACVLHEVSLADVSCVADHVTPIRRLPSAYAEGRATDEPTINSSADFIAENERGSEGLQRTPIVEAPRVPSESESDIDNLGRQFGLQSPIRRLSIDHAGDQNINPSGVENVDSEKEEISTPARLTESVVERTRQLTQKAIDSARRKAYFSARADFIRAIQSVARAIDAASGSMYHSQALARGLQALDEAQDFSPRGAGLDADLNLTQIVASHQTPVLKHDSLDRVTTLQALQAYHQYAQAQLTQSCAKEPIASLALTGLARIQPHVVSPGDAAENLVIPRSMSMYQAALDIDESNALAANELGVMFAKFGQLEDAKLALTHCVTVDPKQSAAWRNLAKVHAKLGEQELAEAALAEVAIAKKSSSAANRVHVNWVNAKTFSAASPKAIAKPQRTQDAKPTPPTLQAKRPLPKTDGDKKGFWSTTVASRISNWFVSEKRK